MRYMVVTVGEEQVKGTPRVFKEFSEANDHCFLLQLRWPWKTFEVCKARFRPRLRRVHGKRSGQ